MKYGVAVTIVQTGYIEVEADCEEEAKAKAQSGAKPTTNAKPSGAAHGRSLGF